jgi:chromosome segregation ATPase
MDVLDRFEQVSANVATTNETTRSVEAAVKSAAADGTHERLGELTQHITSLSSDVNSTVRAVMGLGPDLAVMRSELQALTDSMPDRTDGDAAVQAVVTRLDETIGQRDQQLREEVARLDATLTNRDANVREILSRLDAAIGQTSHESDFADLARQFDAAISELRRDLQSMQQAASSADVFDMVRSMSSDVGELRSDVQRAASDTRGAAGAAQVASAESAVARLEGRMDGEFDTVGRQMEALGTLLGQLVDSVHRVESQVIGVHPVSDKMRTAAASVLETLRASVRERAAVRRDSAPQP